MPTPKIRARVRQVLSARPLVAVVGCVALFLCAGCGAGAAGSAPSWVPKPDFSAGNHDPVPELSVPRDNGPAPAPTGSRPSASPASPAPSAGNGGDPAVLASKLNQPTGLVLLPDGTALVAERSTGRILQVQPRPQRPVLLRQTLTGLDTSGGGGLMDLALSPTYRQDGLIYAYLTTPTDNRVVHFTLGAVVTPVITGIPKGSSDNSGRIAFDATGALLTGTGDAGQPSLAASPSSLAGKILRTDDTGHPLPDNPNPSSPIFASGLRTVDGLCVDPADGVRIAVSMAGGAPNTADEINIVRAGANYGWPAAGTDALGPIASLPTTATHGAGCAVADGHVLIATTDGQALVTATLTNPTATGSAAPRLQQLTPSLIGTYGRLRTVLIGPDGSIWLTTTNRDGHGKPLDADDRVIRLDASSAGSIL